MDRPALLWFRQDLRLADNPALQAVAGRPVLPLFVWDEAAAGPWGPGGAARWWLRHSLAALAADLAARGAPLLVLRGRAEILVPAMAEAVGAAEVHAGRLHEPWARERDGRIAEALEAARRRLRLWTSAVLREPPTVMSGSGKPYAVYTPFAKAVAAMGEPDPPLPAPDRLHPVPSPPAGESLEALGLYPVAGEPDWAREFPALWQPGEAGAQDRLRRFLAGPVAGYTTGRNDPGTEGTSGLSPHLRWGEISPRQVWHAVRQAQPGDLARSWPFLSEILWREFSYHLLWHRPEMPERALRERFRTFPWQPDAALLQAWQRGRTGYPIVDAGMRQLWRFGWMHNRVRMIAASLLVKHLLQPWQAGATWFWDTLVDADLASNSASWQWIAGSGTDAAPYFRVFNPVLQGEKFDPEGRYVRRFVPALAGLPDRYVHRPWEAPEEVRRAAGLALGRDYPRPVVEHAEGRARALAALRGLRGAAEEPAA
ncbi:cryptochrome/photolyase family protein [Paracraurococcus lichenis]|uniref:Deoxyribodipyrimidine photo-lyase n=1 Tax=Paracraurococcus lichenis TaxID=3064888 RepID=A0ABT9DZU8_9PROT|nr:deoxyribodipyrimidine photo-lyase [Paracraurococcus sp. LOR1-02]MDO9709435.1 deoxyribodipyrimidine photo-lyase [Paracraurococcus sp. LOR1-02]